MGTLRYDQNVLGADSFRIGELPIEHDEELTPYGITLRPATDPHELEMAFRLVYQSYLRAGLTESNSGGLRVTSHQLQETSEVFVAVKDQQVISTVSLILDGDLGLPLEDVYPCEVEQLRQKGLKLAEVSCLADRRESVERAKFVLLKLMIMLAQHAQNRGVDKLLIAVHPRHVRFYEKLMGFEQVGDQREYATVLGRPAVALSIDLRRPAPHNGDAFRQFFGRRYARHRLFRPAPRGPEFYRRFQPLATGSARVEVQTV